MSDNWCGYIQPYCISINPNNYTCHDTVVIGFSPVVTLHSICFPDSAERTDCENEKQLTVLVNLQINSHALKMKTHMGLIMMKSINQFISAATSGGNLA